MILPLSLFAAPYLWLYDFLIWIPMILFPFDCYDDNDNRTMKAVIYTSLLGMSFLSFLLTYQCLSPLQMSETYWYAIGISLIAGLTAWRLHSVVPYRIS